MPESSDTERGCPPLASSLLLSQEERAMSSSGKSEPSWNPHGLSAQHADSTARDPWDKCTHVRTVAERATRSPDGHPSGRWGNRQALSANGHPGLGQPAPRSEALLPVGVGGAAGAQQNTPWPWRPPKNPPPGRCQHSSPRLGWRKEQPPALRASLGFCNQHTPCLQRVTLIPASEACQFSERQTAQP